MDAHANFAVSAVATAPSPATSGTSLVVTATEGARFPATPFNAVICPAGVLPTPANSEIVRVTNVATDTFTITRAQESSTARTVVVGDLIFAAITAKTLTDMEAPPLAQAYHNANQSIAHATFTALALNSERFDNDSIHDPTTNNSRLTCKTAGKYLMIFQARFDTTTGGLKIAAILLNNTTYIAQNRVVAPSGTFCDLSCVTIRDMAVNDYIEGIVYQETGSAVNARYDAEIAPTFSMLKVG